MNESKNPRFLQFNGSPLLSGISFFSWRIESSQSETVVGSNPALDDINRRLNLLGYFFGQKAAIFQNSDGLLPIAFIIGLSPGNELAFILFTHEADAPPIVRKAW